LGRPTHPDRVTVVAMPGKYVTQPQQLQISNLIFRAQVYSDLNNLCRFYVTKTRHSGIITTLYNCSQKASLLQWKGGYAFSFSLYDYTG